MKKETKKTTIPHVYRTHEETHLWRVIEEALDYLLVEDDIEIHTRKEYVLGMLCQEVSRDQQSWQQSPAPDDGGYVNRPR